MLFPDPRAIGQHVLFDVIVGGRADAGAKALQLHVEKRLFARPTLIFHTINGRQNAGAMQAGVTMNQHRIIRLIVQDAQELIDGRWSVLRDKMAGQEHRHQVDVAHAQFAAQFAFLDGCAGPRN